MTILASPLPAITERAWQEQVVDLATLYGWRHYHPFDSRRSVAGWPDLVLVRGPELLFAELKAERGRLSKAQVEWLDALGVVAAAADGLVEVHVWRPSDFEAVHNRLKRRAL